MPDNIEQIKSRLDIVDVISGYLKVQKSGVNFKARCPFHNEKTPSFYISPERQIWHCFGCSKGGDMFGFIKEIEGVEFPEALRVLANRAGVELERFNPKEQDLKVRLFQACELATKFFEKQLFHSANGKKALAYLKDRGLTDETISAWRLGFAPDDWHSLETFLRDSGYNEQELIDSGLAIRKERSLYDRFRSRITFPIADVNGQVVGFTARVFNVGPAKPADQEGAKYINTPQTEIYDKSRILYGLNKAKTEVRSADKCLLVEGNMDAIMSSQAGVANVVATSGTALTGPQLRMLQRYTTNLDFCFDTDQAGALATRRGIGLALSGNFNIGVVRIEDAECKDPADYVKKYGSAWQGVVKEAKPVIEFYFEKVRSQYDPQSAASKKSVIAVLAPLIKRLVSNVERSHWVSHLAGFLRVKEDDVLADISAAKDDLAVYERTQEAPASSPTSRPPAPEQPLDSRNKELLGLVAAHKELLPSARLIDPSLLDPRVAVVFQNPAFLEPNAEHEHKGLVDAAYMHVQPLYQEWTADDIKNQLVRLGTGLQIAHLRKENSEFEVQVQQAEASGDMKLRDEMARRVLDNNQRINQLQSNGI